MLASSYPDVRKEALSYLIGEAPSWKTRFVPATSDYANYRAALDWVRGSGSFSSEFPGILLASLANHETRQAFEIFPIHGLHKSLSEFPQISTTEGSELRTVLMASLFLVLEFRKIISTSTNGFKVDPGSALAILRNFTSENAWLKRVLDLKPSHSVPANLIRQRALLDKVDNVGLEFSQRFAAAVQLIMISHPITISEYRMHPEIKEFVDIVYRRHLSFVSTLLRDILSRIFDNGLSLKAAMVEFSQSSCVMEMLKNSKEPNS
jgi:hypothetical protein